MVLKLMKNRPSLHVSLNNWGKRARGSDLTAFNDLNSQTEETKPVLEPNANCNTTILIYKELSQKTFGREIFPNVHIYITFPAKPILCINFRLSC